ncbi:MAG TPA: hypothetical protein VGD53_10220 [Actinoallomurus sp.]|jgi:hypothetical protein
MPRITLSLSIPDANLILEALGQQPYAKVYELVNTIHEQAEAQLRQDPETPPEVRDEPPAPNGLRATGAAAGAV